MAYLNQLIDSLPSFEDAPELDSPLVSLSTRFEEVSLELIANPPHPDAVKRQCRSMKVPDGIESISAGNYCELLTSGGGMCQWYYYVSQDGHRFLMFVHNNNTSSVTGYQINYIPCSFP